MSISRDWNAFYVKSGDGDPDVLHIVGTFDFPGLDYGVRFHDADPGIVPGTIAFSIEIIPPLAGGATPIDTREVEYLVDQADVKHVLIHEGGESFLMDVYIVE